MILLVSSASIAQKQAKHIIMIHVDTTNIISIERNPPRAAKTWCEYAPEITTLNGVIIAVHTLGPPNFGEDPKNDSRITYYALKLNDPINVKADSVKEWDAFFDEDTIGIWNSHSFRLAELVGKSVVVTGSLIQIGIGSLQYTDVLIEPNDITIEGENHPKSKELH